MLKDAFVFVRGFVAEQGFSDEIEWQESVSLDSLTERTFLQEYAWVVLASGMREAVVRKKFQLVAQCFYSWASGERIASNAESCVEAAMQVFRHERKLRAIAFTAALIATRGFRVFRSELESQPLATLRALPYIGPITQYHLAKNVGLNVAKPDRHLSRISSLFGFPTAESFCQSVANDTGAKVSVVDLVFWRFATLQGNYLEILSQFA